MNCCLVSFLWVKGFSFWDFNKFFQRVLSTSIRTNAAVQTVNVPQKDNQTQLTHPASFPINLTTFFANDICFQSATAATKVHLKEAITVVVLPWTIDKAVDAVGRDFRNEPPIEDPPIIHEANRAPTIRLNRSIISNAGTRSARI